MAPGPKKINLEQAPALLKKQMDPVYGDDEFVKWRQQDLKR